MTIYDAINQIRTDNNQSQSLGASQRNQVAADGSVSFSQHLANAMGVDGGQENTGSVEGFAPVSQVVVPQDTSDAAVSAINSLLGTLEQYENALGDSSVSLKEIEPMVADMEKQAGELDRESVHIENQELRDLANSTITQATVESIKFRRGDYV